VTVELKALQQQVRKLEADLTPTGRADPRLRAEWQDARAAERTASAFEAWLAERVTQVAVGWVLSTVFVRFCEDNDLIEYPFIAGPGERTARARDLQQAFYERHPERGDRDWLQEAFDALSVSPVAKALFDEHNPMWSILPSPDQAKALLDFWRQTGEDGELRYDLTDPEWDTRFLGDLYQDLSESARKTYALLQTPEFVEEFILNYTLDPAIEEFGLEPEPPYGHAELPHRLRVIDPACGSGHFLLGAFRRLLTAWQTHAPTTDDWVLIANALSSVHGVDKNPFAVAVARFRLMLAAMRAGDVSRLSANVNFPINIAIGDSLLHGYSSAGSQDELPYDDQKPAFTYRTEDISNYIKSVHILAFGSYHAVFANPPYITVKDKAESEAYRPLYPSCYREYSLSVPFAERIFKLAVRGSVEGTGAGYTGQITANSFMKREFGKKLIQEFFPQVDLTHVIDTSGAYIPGHGTPTVILFGRWRFPRAGSTIRAVLGIRGELGQPADPTRAPVWQAIVDQIDKPGSESEWISVTNSARAQFAKHPWSLSGGGAENLRSLIEFVPRRLSEVVDEIGYGAVTREDDVYMVGDGPLRRSRVNTNHQRSLVEGDTVRDFTISHPTISLWPYDSNNLAPALDDPAQSLLWPHRARLRIRVAYGKTQIERGLTWFEYSMFFRKRFKAPFLLVFAFVATHNHFALDRGGKVFKQTAPIIRLPDGATEGDHLALLGALNSSAACFWLQQVSHNKGEGGGARVDAGYSTMGSEAWKNAFEFAGAKLEQFPLPRTLPLEFGRDLDALAQELAAALPSAVCATGVPTRGRLDVAGAEHTRIRGRMIALQEELDWDVYHRYGLITDEEAAGLVAAPGSVPNIDLGLRAFEIVLARKVAAGEAETQWFARHRSTPVTEIPADWPPEYRDVVARRIELIERDRNIGLIERPECKRRWQSEPWEAKEREALTTWLLDRCEERSLWYGPDDQPKPMTVNRLADRLRADADVVSVARLLAGPDADLADVLTGIIADEHVPCLARARYRLEGLVKRAIWERTWELQREEDRTGRRLDIPVPPKYTSADFCKNSYWRHRGKLDVPKERFISYPNSGPDSDDSVLLGWAGWDHREQAHALIATIEDRASTDGWDGPRLTPLIAGLAEVMPWVRQWHHELDPAFGQSPADAYDVYLTAQREKYAVTDEVLTAWEPVRPARGRRRD
jgi:hypothetical protein